MPKGWQADDDSSSVSIAATSTSTLSNGKGQFCITGGIALDPSKEHAMQVTVVRFRTTPKLHVWPHGKRVRKQLTVTGANAQDSCVLVAPSKPQPKKICAAACPISHVPAAACGPPNTSTTQLELTGTRTIARAILFNPDFKTPGVRSGRWIIYDKLRHTI